MSTTECDELKEVLRRHILDHTREKGSGGSVDLVSFAYNSPFDLPDASKLSKEYVERSFSELRALHEHAQESMSVYLKRLQAATEEESDVEKEELEQWWIQLCLIVARDHVIERLLTSATIHGPQKWEESAGELLEGVKGSRNARSISHYNTGQDIAAKVLSILNNRPPAEWPDTMRELLSEVDDLRGVKDRTTYRYLHDKMGDDKPENMIDWKKWAERTV